MMVRVVDAQEAATAAAAGVDIAEFVLDPTTGVGEAQAVRAAFPGSLRLRVNGPITPPDIIQTAMSVRADEIALPVASPLLSNSSDHPERPHSVALISVGPTTLASLPTVRDRADLAMFDTVGSARLIDSVPIAHLDALAEACRACGLRFGLAGGLEAPDVSRLLLLTPDVLGFDVALRVGHRADGPLDASALDAIRCLIPRDGTSSSIVPDKIEVIDRIFVRDFVVPLAIGAYQAEHGARQRVRFSVEAEIVREPVPPRDMRDVFSYDIIIETIRVLAERAHVTFVETLAEEVAAALLTHPTVFAVSVKVEKLDVIDGIVGIETTRRRSR